MTPADISVVIPTLNEAEHIARCAQSVANAGEIIVVDGGSQDETPKIAAAAGATVLQSEPGRAVQQNAGATIASCEVLLFLHADNFLCDGGLEQIPEALNREPDRWGGAFEQQIEADGWAYRLLEHGNAMRVRHRGLPFGDQAIFVRRGVFESVGGFPDEPLMEDLILSKRLRKQRMPLLLSGPVHISPRRWKKSGVVLQTIRNLALQTAHAIGVKPTTLRRYYP